MTDALWLPNRLTAETHDKFICIIIALSRNFLIIILQEWLRRTVRQSLRSALPRGITRRRGRPLCSLRQVHDLRLSVSETFIRFNHTRVKTVRTVISRYRWNKKFISPYRLLPGLGRGPDLLNGNLPGITVELKPRLLQKIKLLGTNKIHDLGKSSWILNII